MNLKVSLFNKSLYKTDMKRFWIASLLYTVLLFFLVPFQHMTRTYHFTHPIPKEYLMTTFAGNTYGGIFLGMLCGGVFALMIFMYINSTPAISFYHSLPYKRITIYFTKLLSGITLLTLPVLINLGMLLGAKASGTYIPAYYSHIFMWAYLQLAYSLIVFFGVSFVAMFTGNFMYLIAVSGICVLAPLLTITFTESLFSSHLYGYIGSVEQALNWLYLGPNYMLSLRAVIYLVLAILFIVSGCIIYNKRDLEKNGEAVVFNKAKVFFLYLVAFLCGILSYWYFSNLLIKSVLWMLPFGLAGIAGANMINRKQVTLKGFIKPALIYALAVVLLFCVFKFDITGFERRIPKADDIEEVLVSVPMIENNYSVRGTAFSYRDYYDKENKQHSIKNPDEIEKVLALHRHKIENRGVLPQQAYTVDFEYKLKNGKNFKRGYTVFRYDGVNLAEDVLMLENMKAKRFHKYKDPSVKYQHISITHNFVENELGVYLAGSEQFEKLKNALHEDIKNITYEYDTTLLLNSRGANEMLLSIYIEPDFSGHTAQTNLEASTIASGDNKPSVVYTYALSKGFPRTRAILEEMGLYEQIPTVQDITRMYVRHYGEKITEAEVTEREDIEKLYETVLSFDSLNSNYDGKIINIEMRTDSHGFEMSLPENAVKDITKKYMK